MELNDNDTTARGAILQTTNTAIMYFPSETFTIVSKDPVDLKRSLTNSNFKYFNNFILKVQNGSGKSKVQKIEILIDGIVVVNHSDFRGNTNSISKPLSGLTHSSILEVRLEGSRGRSITLLIECSLKPDVISDVDGNYYNTVKIGNHWWTTENLKTTHFNDGSPIELVTEESEWAAMDMNYTGCYCYYNNDISNKDVYGVLYNWSAAGKVEEKEICPVGWHVSSFNDFWDAILVYDPDAPFIYERYVGGAFKETGTTHWQSPNTGATNLSGFTGLPGGNRFISFFNIGKGGYWWLGYGQYFALTFDDTLIYYTYDTYKGAYSVRCVKN